MVERWRRGLFAIVFALVSLAVVVVVGMPPRQLAAGDFSLFHQPDFLFVAGTVVVSVIALALWIAFREGAERRTTVLVPRRQLETEEPPPPPHPYRGGRPIEPSKLSSPRVSTRWTVLVVIACMAFTAAALPFAFHLPRWLEAEVVCVGWWGTWAVALGVLAYRGRPLDETRGFEVDAPFRGWASAASIDAPPRRRRWLDFLDLSFVDLDVLPVAIAVAVVIITVGLAAAWLVVEIAAPALFFVAYLGIATALRRARAASLRGDAARSALHGALWALAYVAPLAAGVALVHAAAAP